MQYWIKKMAVETNKRIYTGHSMAGTFVFGDLLIIEKVHPSTIRSGDILVYRGSDGKGVNNEVVHRVVGSTPDGFVVQGDKNLHSDETLVNEKNLVGRVTHVERRGKRSRVRCKRSGLLSARFYQGYLCVRSKMMGSVRIMGRGSYGWLRKSGLIARLWRPTVVKVQLLTPEGPVVKYISRNRTIASHWLNEGRFKCRKPYDLVMDAKANPAGRRSHLISDR